MVNYCCVYGCGRNSRSHGHLTFYTLPKEQPRQTAWLKACCPEFLKSKLDIKSLRSRRFCSRHFTPSCIKNQRLLPDAVPTLCLTYNDSDNEAEPPQHTGLACDGCGGPIVGFRYKCTECKDFDLCQRCETHEMHGTHYMLRLPKPVDFETAQALTQKWSNPAGSKGANASNDVTITKQDPINCDSSDDEPITKYVTQKTDEVWTIPEYVKSMIRNEVSRAIKASKMKKKPVPQKRIARKSAAKQTNASKTKAMQENQVNFEMEIVPLQELPVKYGPDAPVEFASVDDDPRQSIKSDAKEITAADEEVRQPVMDISLNDTLSEFLIKRI